MKSLAEMQREEVTAATLTQDQINTRDMLRLEMLTSLEKYTKAMFRAQYKRSFIVAEHHRKIIDALQSVVDGKCKRLMINIAPRYGKCLVPEAEILTSQGIKRLRDIVPGDAVYSYRDGALALNRVLAVEPAYKPTVTLHMRSGRSITGSYDHPMLTPYGYKEMREFKEGDRITAIKAEINGTLEISDAELFIVTAMIFDGNCGTTRPGLLRFANADELFMADFREACEKLDIGLVHRDYCKSFEYELIGGTQGHAYRILCKWNLIGHTAYNKRLPKEWVNLPLRQKYLFLSVMIATDGNISKNTGQINIGLANRELIGDIQYLLATMGLVSTVSYKDNDKAGSWVLLIPRQYSQQLYSKLKFYSKQEAADSIMSKGAISLVDTYPYDIIRAEKLTYELNGLKTKGVRCNSNKNISRDKFKRLMSMFPDRLSKYYSDEFYYDEVYEVVPGSAKELIHIEVENDHNFIANGLVSHNTELVIKSFISWCFALNPMCRFLHLSYSDVLVEDNSATIRSIMSEELYKALFPSSALASEKGSSKRWRTKAGGELYAVSTQGQVTGFGAGAVDLDPELDRLDGGNDIFVFDDHTNEMLSMIGARSNVFQGAVVIDDPIKPEDAESDLVRERINNRFETTIRNRTNSRNTPIIIIMQRLHEHDLCGYLQEVEPDEWTVLSLPALITDPDTGEERALWPMKHTVEELRKMREINPVVFDTQYMQDPTPKEGLMYSAGFRTYAPADLPALARGGSRRNYTDTADTGADFHCSICFIDTPEFIYVTDVLFTDAPMEVTEPRQAEMLTRNGVVDCLIESNNGGRGFARNVKRILRSDLHNFKTVVHTFTQTQNKRSRIFTNSAQVQNDVLFPDDWQRRWPKFYSAIMSYRKDNRRRSQHDDAPDCLTGVYEMHSGRGRRKGIRRMN